MTTSIGIIVTIVATCTTEAKSSAQWNKNCPNAIPIIDNNAIGMNSIFSGSKRFREDGLIKDKTSKAKPPKPKRHTDTSMPEMPLNFTKNSELAWPQTPKKAAK
tara:strand:- start:3279 stop:3590 length:312 start_codon:yes stop_codon:yes gene_type:complete